MKSQTQWLIFLFLLVYIQRVQALDEKANQRSSGRISLKLDRLTTEAIPAWRRWEQRASDIEVRASAEMDIYLNGMLKNKTRRSYRFAVKKEDQLVSFVDQDAMAGSTWLVNPRYCADFGNNKSNEPLQIFDFELRLPNERRILRATSSHLSRLHSPCRIQGLSLVDLVANRPNEIVELYQTQDKVSFNVKGKPSEFDPSVYVYRIQLLPAFDWGIESAEVQRGRFSDLYENAYERTADGASYLRSYTMSRRHEGKIYEHETVAFEPPTPCTLTESDFTLSAFGLPEPGRPDPDGPLKRWWLTINVCFLFVALTWYLWRRRSQGA